jgi:hypothetical protein
VTKDRYGLGAGTSWTTITGTALGLGVSKRQIWVPLRRALNRGLPEPGEPFGYWLYERRGLHHRQERALLPERRQLPDGLLLRRLPDGHGLRGRGLLLPQQRGRSRSERMSVRRQLPNGLGLRQLRILLAQRGAQCGLRLDL